jgi:integrase/recombinase XerD
MERPTSKDVLTDEELDALLAQVRTRHPTGRRNLALLLLMADAGLRIGEACALRTRDVVRDNGVITHVTIRNGKGGAPDTSPQLTLRAVRALQTWFEARRDLGIAPGPVFCTITNGQARGPFARRRKLERGRVVNPAYVRAVVKRLRERAGLEKHVSPHTLRHTFAARYLRTTGNLELTRKALRHAHVSTTATAYGHLLQGDVDAGIESLDQANGEAGTNDAVAGLQIQVAALQAEIVALRGTH